MSIRIPRPWNWNCLPLQRVVRGISQCRLLPLAIFSIFACCLVAFVPCSFSQSSPWLVGRCPLLCHLFANSWPTCTGWRVKPFTCLETHRLEGRPQGCLPTGYAFLQALAIWLGVLLSMEVTCGRLPWLPLYLHFDHIHLLLPALLTIGTCTLHFNIAHRQVKKIFKKH